jgi:hypothetical protein
VVNILEGAISGREAVGRPGLRYLKQVDRNTAADSYTAMERVACKYYRWRAANRSKDRRIRRKKSVFTKLLSSFTLSGMYSVLISGKLQRIPNLLES